MVEGDNATEMKKEVTRVPKVSFITIIAFRRICTQLMAQDMYVIGSRSVVTDYKLFQLFHNCIN